MNGNRGSDKASKKGHSYEVLNICTGGGYEGIFGKSFPGEYGGMKRFWARMLFNTFLKPELLQGTKIDRYGINIEAMVAVRCKQNVK